MVTQSRKIDLAPAPPVPLSSLGRGAGGRIASVAGDDGNATRLKALGLCSGSRVEIAATGNPLIVRVLGTRVGVAARLASQVTVVPDVSA